MEYFLFSDLPVFFKGVLSVLIVTLLPGFMLTREINARSACERALLIFLASITTIYAFGTLAGVVGFSIKKWIDAVLWVTLAASVIILWLRPAHPGRAPLTLTELSLLLLALAILMIGPGVVWWDSRLVFGSDALVSWDAWARIWADGAVPLEAYGYPQFISIVWSVPYWLLGPEGQLFAVQINSLLLTLPIFLAGGVGIASGRAVPALLALTAFSLFILMDQNTWLYETLRLGMPDFTAAAFVSGGLIVLSAHGNAVDRRMDGIAFWMFAIAASIKLVCGFFALALLAATTVEAFQRRDQSSKRAVVIQSAMLAVTATLYFVYLVRVANITMPPFALEPAFAAQLANAYGKIALSYPWAWLMLAIVAGGALTFPISSLRRGLFATTIAAGLLLWTRRSAYDLRAALPFLAAGATMLAIAAGERLSRVTIKLPKAPGAPAVLLLLGVILVAAPSLQKYRVNPRVLYDTAQFQVVDRGPKWHQSLLDQLNKGCTIATTYGFAAYIDRFKPFIPAQLLFVKNQASDFMDAFRKIDSRTKCIAIAAPETPDLGANLVADISTLAGRGAQVVAISDQGLRLVVWPAP
jgi:type IV secretory pathway TrbD component